MRESNNAKLISDLRQAWNCIFVTAWDSTTAVATGANAPTLLGRKLDWFWLDYELHLSFKFGAAPGLYGLYTRVGLRLTHCYQIRYMGYLCISIEFKVWLTKIQHL